MKILPKPGISKMSRFRNKPALQTGGSNSTVEVLMASNPVYMAMKSTRPSWSIDLAYRTRKQIATPTEHQSNTVRAQMMSAPISSGGRSHIKADLIRLWMNSCIQNPRTALMITVDVPAFGRLPPELTYSQIEDCFPRLRLDLHSRPTVPFGSIHEEPTLHHKLHNKPLGK